LPGSRQEILTSLNRNAPPNRFQRQSQVHVA
jgi:hypothetical protein